MKHYEKSYRNKMYNATLKKKHATGTIPFKCFSMLSNAIKDRRLVMEASPSTKTEGH